MTDQTAMTGPQVTGLDALRRPDPLAGLPPLPPLDPPAAPPPPKPVVAAAPPVPVPVEPTPAPSAPKPPPTTGWVREALGLLVTPTRRKAAAVAGLASLGAAAGGMKYAYPMIGKAETPRAVVAKAADPSTTGTPDEEYEWEWDEPAAPAEFVGPPLPPVPEGMAKLPTAPGGVPAVTLPDPMKMFPRDGGPNPPAVKPPDPNLKPAAAEVPAVPAPAALPLPEPKPIELPTLNLNMDPSKPEPVKPEPVKPEPVKPLDLPTLPPPGDPAKADPPKPVELPKLDPPKAEKPIELPKLDLPTLEVSKKDPPKPDPVKIEPPKLELLKNDPPAAPKPADMPPLTFAPTAPELKPEPPKSSPTAPELPKVDPVKLEQPAPTSPPPKSAEAPKSIGDPPALPPIESSALPPIEPPKPPAPLPVPTPTPLPVSPPAPKPVERLPAPPTPEVRQAANTSFDEDLHYPKPGDSYAGISRQLLGDERYANALAEYNNGARLDDLRATNRPVLVPPIKELRKRFGTPASRPAAEPASRPSNGRRVYVVPAGGRTMKQIAEAAFGDENYWGRVFDENRGLLPDQTIPPGTRISLPSDARIGE